MRQDPSGKRKGTWVVNRLSCHWPDTVDPKDAYPHNIPSGRRGPEEDLLICVAFVFCMVSVVLSYLLSETGERARHPHHRRYLGERAVMCRWGSVRFWGWVRARG